MPAPLIFLVVAAGLSSGVKPVRDAVDLNVVVNVVTVALIVILFDGGLHLGRRRFREAMAPVVLLGVFGTFATTALIGVAAHLVFGIEWKVAFVLGAALAPTDPAVVFSVLADKEIAGRTSAILEGESGFNDPAGIALLLGFVQLATHHGSLLNVFTTFAVEMAVGAAIGIIGGIALGWLLSNREPLIGSQQPLRALVAVLGIYGLATIAHGSGFIAVLIAGIMLGDEEERHRQCKGDDRIDVQGLGHAEREEGAEHNEGTMRDVDNAHDAEQQAEPQAHDTVDESEQQPVGDELQNHGARHDAPLSLTPSHRRTIVPRSPSNAERSPSMSFLPELNT